MRKRITLLAFIALALASCQKENLSIKKNQPGANGQNMPVSFGSFSGTSKNGIITINFSTTEARNVQYFEIFSGETGNLLCKIGTVIPGESNSSSSQHYSFTDNAPKANPTYYMIGYTCTNDSTYYYDPVIKVAVSL